MIVWASEACRQWCATDEAKLNKLEAVHQKMKEYNRRMCLINCNKHQGLQKLVDNGEQLDHVEEAKLNKLEAARQKTKEYYRHMRERK
jgi:hypothetical protein